MERLAEQVVAAWEAADLSAIGELLDPDVHWGPPGSASPPCRSREQVLAWYLRGQQDGARAQVSETLVRGDTIILGLMVTGRPSDPALTGASPRWQVLTTRDARIIDIVGFETREEALTHAGGTATPPSSGPTLV